MVKIRLMRIGTQKTPHYRLVVVDARQKRSGGYIESLGAVNPRAQIAEPINTERAQYWISQGAQPTATAIQILDKLGVDTKNAIAKRTKAYKARVAAKA
jgi:small subunit ribosomal protein S16